jgi:hypothetical protein
VIHQLHTLSLPNVTLWLATDDFKDGEILEDFSTCEKFPRILSKANYFKPRGDNRFSHGNVLNNVRENVHR